MKTRIASRATTATLSEPGTARLLKELSILILVASLFTVALNLINAMNPMDKPAAIIGILISLPAWLAARLGRLQWSAGLICWGLLLAGFVGAYRVLGLSLIHI